MRWLTLFSLTLVFLVPGYVGGQQSRPGANEKAANGRPLSQADKDALVQAILDEMYVNDLQGYPSRGEYEHCFTLSDTNNEFLPLTPTACDWVVRAVEWTRRQPRTASWSAIATREARRQQEWDRSADEILSQA